MKTYKRKQKRRRGATAVEFALVAPMILIFVVGMVEWGRFEMVRHVASTAAFNAARRGTIPGATATDVEDRAIQILERYWVSGATTTPIFTEEETSVSIQVPMNQNSFVLSAIFGDFVIEREFTLKAD